jgi:hypothetical protein
MRTLLLTVLLTALTLTTSAEEITTGNLLPNGTGSASNLQSIDNTIPNVQSSCSSFTSVNTTCTNQNWNYQEVEVGSTSSGTGSLNYTGNLVGITTDGDTTTQNMLDNGITLDSTTVVQNCEWSGSSSQCGQSRSGRDTFKTTVKILDSDGNTLSQVDQIRNTDSGYYGNADKYTDQVIYNGTGSNQFDWTWTGIDNGSPLVDLGGPNLLGAKLTMTYDNTIISNEIVEEINNIFEELQEDIFEEFTFEEIEEIFEEMITFFEEPPAMEEIMEEEFEEVSFAPMLMVVEEMPMEEEIIMEEEEAVIEKEIIQTKSMFSLLPPPPAKEEIYEESQEIITSFLPMVSQEEETFTEEKELTETGPLQIEPTEEESKEEEVVKEEPTKMASTPKEEIKEEPKKEIKEKESVEKKSTKMVKQTNEKKEVKEKKPTSKVTKKSTIQTKKIAKQKAIQQKKAIIKNLARVMEKVDKDIKNISKNLQIKNIIKMQAMTGDQVSLDTYQATSFYAPKDIYLDQLNLIDNRLIYGDKSLASYIQNDKMEIKARKLQEINSRKQQILMELEVLQNG